MEHIYIIAKQPEEKEKKGGGGGGGEEEAFFCAIGQAIMLYKNSEGEVQKQQKTTYKQNNI